MGDLPLVVIVGPTGVGKTDLSIALCKRIQGEIINADSRQVYKDLNKGTAKPSPQQRSEVRHHLVDILSLTDPWDVKLFQKLSDESIQDIRGRNKIPVVSGGTALYVKALLWGVFEGPAANEPLRMALKEQARREGLKRLVDELRKNDPSILEKIHPNDEFRIIRALEVFELTGKPLSTHQKEHGFSTPRYRFLKVGLHLEREILYEKINQRVQLMIAEGLEEEAAALYQMKVGLDILENTIGYKEWPAHWRGEQTIQQTLELIQKNTRNYAKRQLTWLKQEKDIHWFEAGDEEGINTAVDRFLSRDRL